MITSVGAAFGSAALAVAPAGCFISAVGAAFGSAALAVAPAGCSVSAGMRAQAAGRSASSIVPAPSTLLHDAYLIVHLLQLKLQGRLHGLPYLYRSTCGIIPDDADMDLGRATLPVL